MGTLVKVVAEAVPGEGGLSEDEVDDDGEAGEQEIARCLLKVLYDGSPLVRTELAIGTFTLLLDFVLGVRLGSVISSDWQEDEILLF